MIELPETDYIIGSDEAGSGAYAGPMCVTAILASRFWKPSIDILVRDSKDMTAKQREKSFAVLSVDIGLITRHTIFVTASQIDENGVYKALLDAHRRAHAHCLTWLESRELTSCVQIADGTMKLGSGILSVPKADSLYPVVSAASICAKVTRDQSMVKLGALYPPYRFEKNKGYNSKEHEKALAELGPCPEHRRSFDPVQRALRNHSKLATELGE